MDLKSKISLSQTFNLLLKFLVSLANSIGILLYWPLLFVVAMSFDAPGSGRHWAHWVFVIGNVVLGPLCLVGLVSPSRRHWGIYGFAIATASWAPLILVCMGEYACR